MRKPSRSSFLPGVFTLLLAAWLYLGQAKASTTDVIYSFAEDDGEYTETNLEIDAAGNLFGTPCRVGNLVGARFGS